MIRHIEALQAEFVVMKRRMDELSAHQHTENIDISIGVTVARKHRRNRL
ncbi:MAG: hypothetical protein U0795_03270 [Pirellulales bacterium]